MKNPLRIWPLLLLSLFIATGASGQSSTFTYQGRLMDNAAPANGIYDLHFTIYDASAGGTAVAATITNSSTSVSNGLFTVELNPGVGVFNGADRWLEIGVRTNGSLSAFNILSPRQFISSAPYAIRAQQTPASGIQGTISNSQLPTSVVSNGATGVSLSGTFNGNGAGLANVNAAALSGLTASNFWQLGGNNVGPNQFIGSTNNQPVEVRAGGLRVMQLSSEPDWGTVRVAGGSGVNLATGYGATIAGGGATNFLYVPRPWTNFASGNFSAVGGGAGNKSFGEFSDVAGGRENVANGDYTFIGGGTGNSNNATLAVIGGGAGNVNGGVNGTIGGGSFNRIVAQDATIAGGTDNFAAAQASAIGGGSGNIAGGAGATVGGGGFNGFVSGGNQALGSASTIGGGFQNLATDQYATIGGGAFNTAGYQAVVGGGNLNSSTGVVTTVAGGQQNIAGSTFSSVGGGYQNTNTGYAATIAGGYQNLASGDSAVVAGGVLNIATTNRATVSGGAGNAATGSYGTVPGGQNNLASGQHSLAAGLNAKALHQSSFVWSDSQAGQFSSTSSNQFVIRSQAGVGINTNNPQATLHVNGDERVTGLVRLGSEQGTHNSFTVPGLVVRRVESLSQTAGQIVARTDVLTLERDGSNSGLLVRYPASPGLHVVNAIGMNNAGALVPFRTVINNPGSSGTLQVFTGAQRIVHAQITFGDVYHNNGRVTQLVLDRTDDGVSTDDYYWVGTLTSNFNQ